MCVGVHRRRRYWECRGEGREARGKRYEGMRREELQVERCTLKVGRQRGGAQRCCAWTGSRGHGSGARREELQVERCTLKVGRQRGGAQRGCACASSESNGGGEARGNVGAQRCCAWTGSRGHGSGARREELQVERCTLNVGRQRGGAQRGCACASSESNGGGEARGEGGEEMLTGVDFWQAPACYRLFQASGRPNSPFSPCGRRGLGGCSQG